MIHSVDTAWANVAVGALAAIPAYIGVVAARVRAGVAEGQAQRAEERAEGALEAYQRMADSLDKIAGHASGVTATNGSPVAFMIEWRRDDLYTLRNLGPQTATNVAVSDEGLPIIADVPAGETLRPLEAREMYMVAAMAGGMPVQLIVTCDELDEPVVVPVPKKF